MQYIPCQAFHAHTRHRHPHTHTHTHIYIYNILFSSTSISPKQWSPRRLLRNQHQSRALLVLSPNQWGHKILDQHQSRALLLQRHALLLLLPDQGSRKGGRRPRTEAVCPAKCALFADKLNGRKRPTRHWTTTWWSDCRGTRSGCSSRRCSMHTSRHSSRHTLPSRCSMSTKPSSSRCISRCSIPTKPCKKRRRCNSSRCRPSRLRRKRRWLGGCRTTSCSKKVI